MSERLLRLRGFTDRTGTLWRVSEVAGQSSIDPRPRERRAEARSTERPAPKAKRLVTRPLELPWLCFESRVERRRVAPVPDGWHELPEDELEDLLGTSQLLWAED